MDQAQWVPPPPVVHVEPKRPERVAFVSVAAAASVGVMTLALAVRQASGGFWDGLFSEHPPQTFGVRHIGLWTGLLFGAAVVLTFWWLLRFRLARRGFSQRNLPLVGTIGAAALTTTLHRAYDHAFRFRAGATSPGPASWPILCVALGMAGLLVAVAVLAVRGARAATDKQ